MKMNNGHFKYVTKHPEMSQRNANSPNGKEITF